LLEIANVKINSKRKKYKKVVKNFYRTNKALINLLALKVETRNPSLI
jgi:hypothetical protein